MNKTRQIVIAFILLSHQCLALSQALSWLSKPQHEMGLVVNADIDSQKLSANGRYVTFVSEAGNLVAGDDNYGDDVFIKDLMTGEIERVSELSNGISMNTSNIYHFSTASDDGRYVSFISNADNLPMADGDPILYLKDLQTGILVADSVDASGQQVYGVETYFGGFEQSKDGRYVAFTSSDNIINNPQLSQNVFRKDRQTNSYQLISVDHNGMAAGGALLEDMSANGQYITFRSDQEILPGTPNPVAQHNYLRDMSFSNTVLYHKDINNQAVSGHYIQSSVSDTGLVAFCSLSDSLVTGDNNLLSDVFVYNNGSISRISLGSGQQQITDSGCYSAFLTPQVEFSADGTVIGFLHPSNELTSQDNGGRTQAYAYLINTNQLQMISKNTQSQSADQNVTAIALNEDGSRYSLLSAAGNLNHPAASLIYKNIFIHNQNNNQLNGVPLATESVTHLLADAINPVLTADMSQVLYASLASNADPSNSIDTYLDLFLYNRNDHSQVKVAGQIKMNSHDMSDNGRYVVFVSNRFQPNNSIELGDDYVFLLDQQTNQFSQIAVGNNPKVSDDGQVVFSTGDDSLSATDNNGFTDIYLYNSQSQQLTLVSVGMNNDAANANSLNPDIGGIGIATWVVFVSFADNLVIGDSEGLEDVFMVNWPQGTIQRVTETALGDGQNAGGFDVAIASNTQYIVFSSLAQNLVPANYPLNSKQIFLYDRSNDVFSILSLNDSNDPHEGNSFGGNLSISATGRFISFGTDGYFGHDDEQNSQGAVYLYDQSTGSHQRISQQLNGDDLTLGSRYAFVQADENVVPALVSVAFSDQGELLDPRPSTLYHQAMLYQQGGAGVDLNMQVTGDGTVSGNLGYFCQANCNNTYDLGTTLNLIAVPDNGASFIGWSGDACQNNSQNCTVVMNESKSMQAIFSSNDVIFAHGFE